MAHMWNPVPTPFLDANGTPLSGGKAYFFVGPETSTPLPTYEEYSLSDLNSHPVVADGNGVFPPVFLPNDTLYRVRVESADGESFVYDVGGISTPATASEGGGGGEGTVIPPSFVMWAYRTGPVPGWVRANGRTIGSSTSAATERANDDTEDLFAVLWTDNSLTVSGGRGANAAADFASNKTITLPDTRGRVPGGLDGMGNTLAGRLLNNQFALADVDTLGNYGGAAQHTLIEDELPEVTATSTAAGAHNHTYDRPNLGTGGDGGSDIVTSRSSSTTSSVANHTHDVSFGGGDPHDNVQPTILVTFYIKL